MRALVKDLHADDKGRAVVLLVADCSADELRRRLASNPTSIDLMTRTQIADTVRQSEPPALVANQAGTLPDTGQHKGGKLCQWLAAREREPKFHEFLRRRYGRNVSTPVQAEAAVKDLLQFTSRTQLDNDAELGARFKKEIMLELQGFLSR